MRQGNKFERTDETKETMELQAKSEVSPEIVAALTDENSGILKPGLLPQMDASTPAGSKALLESIGQAWTLVRVQPVRNHNNPFIVLAAIKFKIKTLDGSLCFAFR